MVVFALAVVVLFVCPPAVATTTAAAVMRPVPRANLSVMRTVSARTSAMTGMPMAVRRTSGTHGSITVPSIADKVGVMRFPLRMHAMRVVLRSPVVATATLGMPMVRTISGARGSILILQIIDSMGVAVLRSPAITTAVLGMPMVVCRTRGARGGIMVYLVVDSVGVTRLVLRFLGMRVVLRPPALATAMLGMPMLVGRTGWARGSIMVFFITGSVGAVRCALRMPAMRVVLRSSAVTTAMIGVSVARRTSGARGSIVVPPIVDCMGVGLVLRPPAMGVMLRSSSMSMVLRPIAFGAMVRR